MEGDIEGVGVDGGKNTRGGGGVETRHRGRDMLEDRGRKKEGAN